MTTISGRTRVDIWLATALFVGAFSWAACRVDPMSSNANFYQRLFAPAVMRAIGYGFIQPASQADVVGLGDFLARKQSDLPEFAPGGPVPTQPNNNFQSAHRYLMESAAMCWRVLGVSWSSLWPLYGALFAIMAVSAYGLSRALLSPVLATAAAVAFCLSTPVSNQLPHLRDFSKAPFVLLALALLVHAVIRKATCKRLLLQSAVIGGVIGVGLGFRMDLIVVVPIAAVLLVGFARPACRASLFMRLATLLVIVSTAAIVSSPILMSYTRGSNSWHVVILGLMTSFNDALGVVSANTHEIGWRYNDSYVAELVNDYARRELGVQPLAVEYGSAAYDAWSVRYYLEVVRLMPADVAVRVLGAVTKAYSAWLGHLLGLGAIALTAAFLCAARLRWGFMLLVVLAYFGALVSLQYDERHAFYLGLAPIVALGFLLQLSLDQCARSVGFPSVAKTLLLRTAAPSHMIRRGSGGRLVALGCIGVTIPVALAAARIYQSSNVRALLDRLEQIPPVQCSFNMSVDEGLAILTPAGLPPDTKSSSVGSRLWLIEFALPEGGDREMAEASLWIAQDCGAIGEWGDHSRELTFPARRVELGSRFLRYVFFTLNRGCPDLRVKLKADLAPMVVRFCELDTAKAGPILVNALLPVPGVEPVPYQRLGRSSVPAIAADTFSSFPSGFRPGRSIRRELLLGAAPLSPEDIAVVDPGLVIAPGTIAFNGDPKSPYHYIAGLGLRATDGDDVLVVSGVLYNGGIGLGLLQDNKWWGQIQRSTPGAFEFFVRPPPGSFRPMLFHLTPSGKSRFEVHKYDWVRISPR